MPTAHKSNLSNFEAIFIGFCKIGEVWNFGTKKMYFIVPNDYQRYLDDEVNFQNSRFVGTKEQCERNLIDYPNCKII